MTQAPMDNISLRQILRERRRLLWGLALSVVGMSAVVWAVLRYRTVLESWLA